MAAEAMLRQSTPAAGPDRFRAELEAFGLSQAQIDAMVKAAQGAAREDGIEVFAWCAPALRWFLAMASQWRRDGDGRALGLDYGAAEGTARMSGLSIGPDDFARLQVLEQAVLWILLERQKRCRLVGGRR